jgi:hypothetical protein
MPVKCEACQHEHADWVPQSRLDKALTQKRDAAEASKAHLAKIGELETQLATAEQTASSSAELQAEVDRLKAEQASFGVEREILQAGITDQDGIDLVQYMYNKLDADDRPSVSDWLGGDSLPKGIRAYMPTEGTSVPTEGTQAPEPPAAAPAAPTGLPSGNAGVTPTSPSEPGVTPERMRAVRMRAQTGDPSAVAELKTMLGQA